VHLARLRDGRRVVFQVATVDGLRDGEAALTEVFRFAPRLGAAGGFVCNGVEPAIAATLRARGERVPPAWFVAGPDRNPVEAEAGPDHLSPELDARGR